MDENHKAELCFRFERERAEGEGAFFEASEACEKKDRRPVKRERARQSHQTPYF